MSHNKAGTDAGKKVSLQGVLDWFAKRVPVAERLLTRIGRARAGQEEAKACKMRAQSNLTQRKAGIAAQDELKGFLENLATAAALPPNLQPFALAKMVDLNPNLLQRVEKVRQHVAGLQDARSDNTIAGDDAISGRPAVSQPKRTQGPPAAQHRDHSHGRASHGTAPG